MSKVRKLGKATAWTLTGATMLVVGGALVAGTVAVANVGQGKQAEVVETVPAVDLAYLTEIEYVNGLAAEQEAEAAAAEQARVTAEAAAAEATRVAAEQAAAAEAERVAAEQQAAVEEEPTPEDPGESGGGGIPATWIDLGNGTGMWDFSHCPTQSGSTGPDGNVYCN